MVKQTAHATIPMQHQTINLKCQYLQDAGPEAIAAARAFLVGRSRARLRRGGLVDFHGLIVKIDPGPVGGGPADQVVAAVTCREADIRSVHLSSNLEEAMYVEVDLRQEPAATALREPEDFKAFKLTAIGVDERGALHRALGPLGSVDDDGAHAWLKLDGVRALAGEVATSASWLQSFDAMVAYAASKGWLSADLKAIRAHVERISSR